MAASLGIKLARLLIVIAIFAAWEVLSRTGIVNPRLLPSASDTLSTLAELLRRTSIRNDLLATAIEVLAAFALAFGPHRGVHADEQRPVAGGRRPVDELLGDPGAKAKGSGARAPSSVADVSTLLTSCSTRGTSSTVSNTARLRRSVCSSSPPPSR